MVTPEREELIRETWADIRDNAIRMFCRGHRVVQGCPPIRLWPSGPASLPAPASADMTVEVLHFQRSGDLILCEGVQCGRMPNP